MKKMENTFAVTGFVGKDASIHQFSTASVARFSLAISRIEKNGEENTRTSAFMNVGPPPRSLPRRSRCSLPLFGLFPQPSLRSPRRTRSLPPVPPRPSPA